MAKGNRKPEVDVERELPPAEDDGFQERPSEAAAAENEAVAAAAPAVTAGEEELRKLKTERDLLYERLARQQAEFENYRKRAAREQSEFREYAIAEALKQLLPIVDSFDRALKAHAGEENFRGIELINKQLHDALAKLGVRPIPAVGEPFDPHLHEAVEMVETTEGEDNRVLAELQRGYKLKDRLLRPAMVRVARVAKK